MQYITVKRFSAVLEICVVVLALAALLFRASVYWLLPPLAGESYGWGDVLDFALGLTLFFVSGLCAIMAVVMSIKGQGLEQQLAFRPAVVGITSFVVYYYLHPHMPQLI